jgi:hypothetical protein
MMLGLGLLILTGVSSCRTPATPQEKFDCLFEGYKLLRSGAIPSNANWRIRAASGDFSDIPGLLPGSQQQLSVGTVYVFEKQSSSSEQTDGLKRLPSRLKTIGASLEKYPTSDRDLMWTYLGGPLFNIEFKLDSHDGLMFNFIHADPKEEGLVVVYR